RVVAVHLEGDEPTHRGGELRALSRTEDDAAVINQVIDREDVGLVVDRYCKPTDDGLPEQAPRFRSAENRHRLMSAVTHVPRVSPTTGLVSAEGPTASGGDRLPRLRPCSARRPCRQG